GVVARKITMAMPWTRATWWTWNGSRWARSSPAWGPLPVTIVPVISTRHPAATRPRTAPTRAGVAARGRGAVATGPSPGPDPAGTGRAGQPDRPPRPPPLAPPPRDRRQRPPPPPRAPHTT